MVLIGKTIALTDATNRKTSGPFYAGVRLYASGNGIMFRVKLPDGEDSILVDYDDARALRDWLTEELGDG